MFLNCFFVTGFSALSTLICVSGYSCQTTIVLNDQGKIQNKQPTTDFTIITIVLVLDFHET